VLVSHDSKSMDPTCRITCWPGITLRASLWSGHDAACLNS
jgi:hypothetical protein